MSVYRSLRLDALLVGLGYLSFGIRGALAGLAFSVVFSYVRALGFWLIANALEARTPPDQESPVAG